MKKIIILLFTILIENKLYAGSCCGGGSSSSLIIVGDNLQEYSFGLSYRNDLGQTDSSGWATFHDDTISDYQESLNFQLTRQLADYFQAAFKTALVQKNIEKQHRHEVNTGLGDIDLQTTYEFLPEYTYSLWKPRGFLYLKLTIPMSKSLYDSKSELFTDVRGSGLYSLSVGSFFIKHISDYTLKVAIEWQHYFGKNFDQTTLKDYDKLVVPLGLSYGFDPMPLAIGLGVTWNYQAPKKFTGTITSTSNKEYFWEINTFVNWIISRETSVGISYSDSTLVGKNINSPLYRSFALTYTKSIAL